MQVFAFDDVKAAESGKTKYRHEVNAMRLVRRAGNLFSSQRY